MSSRAVWLNLITSVTRINWVHPCIVVYPNSNNVFLEWRWAPQSFSMPHQNAGFVAVWALKDTSPAYGTPTHDQQKLVQNVVKPQPMRTESICTCTCPPRHMNMHTYVCIRVCKYINRCACTYMYLYISMYMWNCAHELCTWSYQK